MNKLLNLLVDHAASILGVLIGAAFGAYLARRNNRLSRRADAAATFRAAFYDAQRNIDLPNVLASVVVHEFHERHLQAIDAFRPHLPRLHRHGFDAACHEYQKVADSYRSAGLIAQFASDETPVAKAQRMELKKSIARLISYAEGSM